MYNHAIQTLGEAASLFLLVPYSDNSVTLK